MNKNKPINNIEARQIQLDILIEIDNFCTSHNIMYSLAYGTLIGAVRHKGYIPWDDDVDIMMTRENYEKFRSLYTSEKYPFVDLKNDITHPVTMGKVYDSSTYFFYKKRIRRKYGLFVDVFPLDKVPTCVEERKKWLKEVKRYAFLNEIINNKVSNLISLQNNKMKKLEAIIIKIFIKKEYIHNKLESLFQMFRNSSSTIIGFACGDTHEGDIFIYPIHFFDNYITLDFEGHQFQAIEHYDEFLKTIYGDYMKLPPEEERVGKHGIVAYYKE